MLRDITQSIYIHIQIIASYTIFNRAIPKLSVLKREVVGQGAQTCKRNQNRHT
jgi:hypothetical protein